MIKLSTIRKFCVFSVLALLLAAWLPLFAASAQALCAGLGTTQLKPASELSSWPMEVWQAEFVAASDGQDAATNTTAKAPIFSAGTPFVPRACNPSSFHLTPRCQMRRFGSAILPERAPPCAHS